MSATHEVGDSLAVGAGGPGPETFGADWHPKESLPSPLGEGAHEPLSYTMG